MGHGLGGGDREPDHAGEARRADGTRRRRPRVPLRAWVTPPPRGLDRVRWWGPGLLWAMSSVGSGSVLFTPRGGAEYGYGLL